MNKSIWQDNINMPEFKNRELKNSTDVLVIGGGIFGILCAYFLKEKGIDYMLLEKDEIASKTTKGTTGKITLQHGLIYSDLIKTKGIEYAKKYFSIYDIAVKKFEELSHLYSFDYENKKAYTYTLSNLKKIEEELKAYEKLGIDGKFEKETELPFMIKGALSVNNQGQIHPLKFIKEIAKDLNIFENVWVKRIEKGYVETSDKKIIRANKIIVATHFPIINKEGFYFVKLYQDRSSFVAVKNAQKLDNMYIDEKDTGLSLRSYNDYLIIGGDAHRTGTKSDNKNNAKSFVNQYYKNSPICFSWAAQDTMSLDKVPYIGKYSKANNFIFTATGFNKWGLTGAMVAAMCLTDLICDKQNDYLDIFSPQRSILKPQLFVNLFDTAVNYINPFPKRCPHLGCALKWNKYEHSWDCSCHGSRFDENGNILDNPANNNLKKF